MFVNKILLNIFMWGLDLKILLQGIRLWNQILILTLYLAAKTFCISKRIVHLLMSAILDFLACHVATVKNLKPREENPVQ